MSNDPQNAKQEKARIAPMLSVRHGARAIEFYKAAFGADELFRIDSEAGEVVAQLSVAEPNSGSQMSLLITSTSAPIRSAVGRCEW
jgi:uncharacterized glyoxalase superfamily protein PhnB